MNAIGYVRVSTNQQDVSMQEEQIRRYAQHRELVLLEVLRDEGISGASRNRPAFDSLLSIVKRRDVDVVVVYKIDRLGRSLHQVINAFEDMKQLGVELVSINDTIDTTTHQGKFFFHVIIALAELERSVIVDRVRHGIEDARRRGVRIGRPKLSLDIDQIISLRKQGQSLREIAAATGVSYGTVFSLLKKAIPKRAESSEEEPRDISLLKKE